MGIKFAEYLSERHIVLMELVFFILFSALIGLLITRKSSDSNIRTNNTTVVEIKEYINTTITKQKEKVVYRNATTSNDDYSPLVILLVVSLVLAKIYSRYHSLIMDSIVIISIITFTLSATMLIRLYRNNNLDGLSKYWIIFSWIITAYNLLSIYLMSKQDVNVNVNYEFVDIARIVYYFLGTATQMLSNVFTLFILTYLVSMNIFLNKRGNISGFIVRKLHMLFSRPIANSIVIGIFIILSFLLSSGVAYDFIVNLNHSVPT